MELLEEDDDEDEKKVKSVELQWVPRNA